MPSRRFTTGSSSGVAAPGGDKLTGLQLLQVAGIPVPATQVLTSAPAEFPEVSSDVVIFRPNLPTTFDANAVEAHSGEIDSIVVRRGDWLEARAPIAELIAFHEVLLQPYIEHDAGAIAHFWPTAALMRFAIAPHVSSLASGEDAAVDGYLDILNARFVTNTPVITSSVAALIAGVMRIAPRLRSLPVQQGWEFELCLDRFGTVIFLQAQPSSTACPEEWE